MPAPIGKGLKLALLEAFSAAASLLPDAYAKEFVLVGGALLYLGSTRTTGDVDFLITAQSLNEFEAAAKNDSRFSKDSMEQWHYTSSAIGITIAFEFLAAAGGFVSASKDPQPTSLGGFIPSLEELAVMKAHAFNDRSEPHDRSDLVFILRMMSDAGMQFENLNEEDKEVLYELAQPADQVDGDLISRLLDGGNLSIKVHLTGPQVPNLYLNSE